MEEAEKELQDNDFHLDGQNILNADQIMSDNFGEIPLKTPAYFRKIEYLESKKISKDECLYVPDYGKMPDARVVDDEIECN